MSNIIVIKEILLGIDPNMSIIEEKREDGGTMLIGPFPSFIFMLDIPGQDDGFIISVNADAPNIVYFISKVLAKVPNLENYGPYAEDQQNNSIVGGPDAYFLKDEFALRKAVEILAARKLKAEKESFYKPKIIVPGNQPIFTG